VKGEELVKSPMMVIDKAHSVPTLTEAEELKLGESLSLEKKGRQSPPAHP